MTHAVDDHAQARPSDELRPFVSRYGGSIRSGSAVREAAECPSRHVTLIVNWGEPVDVVAMPENLQAPGRFQSFVAGLHAAPARVRDTGSVRLVHAFLTPLGVRSLFGIPAESLASRVVELGDLLGSRARELEARLEAARAWPERFGILDDVLARKLDEVAPAPELAWAWRRLTRAGGALRIDSLAKEVGWSRRHFAERFRREIGHSPKTVARVLRFERASTLLANDRPTRLSDVAAACGYADQSHLSREWTALTGLSPRSWLAEELPFLQDYELEARVSWGS